MQYKYAREQLDYSDFASGRVFHSLPGYPAFPVRLANEIFQRCVAYRESIHKTSEPCILYDPCCGAAYHLSVLAFLQGKHIREVIASDVDEKAVTLAGRNLDLLDPAGFDKRENEISQMFEKYGRDSHRDALQSAKVLKKGLSALIDTSLPVTKVFQANALDGESILTNLKPRSVDIVFTDVPYGQHASWHESRATQSSSPIWSMLDALLGVLSPSSIVAVVSDKHQKAAHESYQRIERFQVGKRRVLIFRPV